MSGFLRHGVATNKCHIFEQIAATIFSECTQPDEQYGDILLNAQLVSGVTDAQCRSRKPS